MSMEFNEPILPSSPPNAEGELGEFLDGILFSSPADDGLLTEEQNALADEIIAGQAARALAQTMAESRQSATQMTTMLNPARKVAGKTVETLQRQHEIMVNKPAEEEEESSAVASKPRAAPESKPKAKPKKESKPKKEENITMVKPSDVTPKDVFCVRGNSAGQQGNVMFRQLISCHKKIFESLTTHEEKNAFATRMWHGVRDKGHRFLKPHGNSYELLDHDKSVQKCLIALRDNRTKKVSGDKAFSEMDVASVSDSFDYTKSVSLPAPPPPSSSQPAKKKQKTTASGKVKKSTMAGPPEEKNFDDTALQSIAEMLSTPELVSAMEKNWGDEVETKKQCFTDQVLKRYRAAAQKGMSVKDYSSGLLPVLLKEIEDATERDNEDVSEETNENE